MQIEIYIFKCESKIICYLTKTYFGQIIANFTIFGII